MLNPPPAVRDSSRMTSTDQRAESASSLKIYLRLLSYVKPYIGYFALSILGYIIFASSQPMLAGILKYFVDGLGNPEAAMRSEEHTSELQSRDNLVCRLL